jgi:hypothetical protein
VILGGDVGKLIQMLMRVLAVAALFGAAMYGEDITIPLDDGRLVIRDAQFIRVNNFRDYVPELSFRMTNETSSPWRTVKLRFNVDGTCNGEPHRWSFSAEVGIAYMASPPVMESYFNTIDPLVGKVDGCKAETIKASLVTAESPKVRINGVTGERVELEEELRQITAKRDAEEAVRAEEQRKAAAVQAKKDAAEAARRKRLAAEQKKKDAERDARIARSMAEEEAKAAEERRRVRTACYGIYQSTVDKKVKDLTVGEEQQVRACQALGLYPPR